MSKQRVYKLAFSPGSTELGADLPEGAEVVHFAEQNNILCLWYIHPDGDGATERRHFSIRGTGHDITSAAAYIDTALVGPYVFHLFETTPEKEA